MRLAQTLYEAGHITYMRTDSTNLSADALTMARGYIEQDVRRPKYLPEKPNFYSLVSNKSAQEAHEAIRPTDATLTPAEARAKLGADEAKLYQLIWNRFVACQMPPAEFDQTTVTLAAPTKGGDAVFRATGRKLVFDGFMKVAGISSEDQLLPELAEGQPVFPIELDPTQHFTQPPPRFTEASAGEGAGAAGHRPAQHVREHHPDDPGPRIRRADRPPVPRDACSASIVTDKLIQAFPEIMDVKFTAGHGTEARRDRGAAPRLDQAAARFLRPVPRRSSTVRSARSSTPAAAPSPYKCPKCGKPMVYRISKNGFFLSCTGYPECDGTQPVDQQGKPTLREVSRVQVPRLRPRDDQAARAASASSSAAAGTR